MNIDGLVYLLNQAGSALAEANGQIARLAEENQALRTALANENSDQKTPAEANASRTTG